MIDLSSLNEEQKQAVTHGDGPLLIVAGAGTGKTTVVTNRVAHLIDTGLAKPNEILCLTFTEKAATEMEERVDKLLPYGYIDVWVMTFHAFAERLLREHAIDLGLPSDFKLLDETGQWLLAYRHFEHMPVKLFKPFGSPGRFIKDFLQHVSRLKDEGVTPEQYLDYAQDLSLNGDHVEFIEFGKTVAKAGTDADAKALWTQEVARRQELADCYAFYQRLLRESHAMDFGDLIMYLNQLFERRPALLERYRAQFKYILVDEFQDTNWAQYAFVKQLATPRNNITVVGDDDQSVYKFRGASLSNILGFHKDFPECTQVVLTHNYRSSQNILDLAYGFIQKNNPNRLEFQLQQSRKKGTLKRVSKQLVSAAKGTGVIEHLHLLDSQEEARAVIDKILSLRKEHQAHWSDFAILVRANNHADLFLQQLTVAGIPYLYLASDGLFSKPAVLDVIAFLKAIDRATESRALYRLLILPSVDMANEDLLKLLDHADKNAVSLHEALKQAAALGLSPEGKEKADRVLTLLETHSRLARRSSVSEVAMAFIDDYGLKPYFETLDPATQQETYALLNQFWRLMRQFESEEDDTSVGAFLAFLELTRTAGDSGSLPIDVESGPDTVKVMTIHGSKGLEFKHVFIVNMVDRRFPSASRRDPLPIPTTFVKEPQASEGDAHLEEERRLCYVAMTRAKQTLVFTSAEDYGGSRAKKVSRFLSELGFAPTEAARPVGGGLPMFAQGWRRSHEAAKAGTMDYKAFLPKKFSHTQLQTFDACPWRYRYAYILKIPKRGNHTQSFGSSLHKTLEKFFKIAMERAASSQARLFAKPRDIDAGKPPTVEELLTLFDESWQDHWYRDQKQKEEYRQLGRDILRQFYKLHAGAWPQVIGAEQRFTIKMGAFSLGGAIDRIDKGEKGLRIVDYKSSKSPKTLTSDKKSQLILYQIALEETLKQPVESLTLYYLSDNKPMTFMATEKQKDSVRLKTIKLLEALAASDFAPTPSKEVCGHCDYRDMCQFRVV